MADAVMSAMGAESRSSTYIRIAAIVPTPKIMNTSANADGLYLWGTVRKPRRGSRRQPASSCRHSGQGLSPQNSEQCQVGHRGCLDRVSPPATTVMPSDPAHRRIALASPLGRRATRFGSVVRGARLDLNRRRGAALRAAFGSLLREHHRPLRSCSSPARSAVRHRWESARAPTPAR